MQEKKNRRGFVFLFIIAALIGYAVYLRYPTRANLKSEVRGELTEISRALDLYFQDCRDFPTAQQGLDALLVAPDLEPHCQNWLGPYYTGQGFLDPWGHRYAYERDGAYYTIKSYGADGRFQGKGLNADISL